MIRPPIVVPADPNTGHELPGRFWHELGIGKDSINGRLFRWDEYLECFIQIAGPLLEQTNDR